MIDSLISILATPTCDDVFWPVVYRRQQTVYSWEILPLHGARTVTFAESVFPEFFADKARYCWVCFFAHNYKLIFLMIQQRVRVLMMTRFSDSATPTYDEIPQFIAA